MKVFAVKKTEDYVEMDARTFSTLEEAAEAAKKEGGEVKEAQVIPQAWVAQLSYQEAFQLESHAEGALGEIFYEGFEEYLQDVFYTEKDKAWGLIQAHEEGDLFAVKEEALIVTIQGNYWVDSTQQQTA